MVEDFRSLSLNTRTIPGKLIVYDQLSSTIDYLSSQDASIQKSVIVAAREQTKGKGRLGRTWQSGFDMGYWFSFYQDWPAGAPPFFLLIFALALAIRTFLLENNIDENRILLKWPNDVMVDGRKICGILLKSVLKQNQISGIITGIGLNANYQETDFSGNFKNTSTSLRMIDGEERDILRTFPALIQSIDNSLEQYKMEKFKSILSSWRKYSHCEGDKISILAQNGKKIWVDYADVDENGALMVYIDGKRSKMMTADVGV